MLSRVTAENVGDVFLKHTVVTYRRDRQKAHSWPKKTPFGLLIDKNVKNATFARGEETKKTERKKRKTQRCDKSRICPGHPRRASPT